MKQGWKVCAAVPIRAQMAGALLALCFHANAAAQPALHFTDVTEEAGLAHEGPSFAVAAADYNKDGWVDVAISNHGDVTLHQNMGDGTFTDVSDRSQFERGIDTHGVTWVDWDNDEWLDLFVPCGGNRGMGNGNPNRLYLNDGQGRFGKGSLPALIEDPEAGSRSACPVDVDGDGRLDLILMNFVRPDRGQHIALRADDGWVDVAEAMEWTERSATSLRFLRLAPEDPVLMLCQTAGAEAGALFAFEPRKPVRELTGEFGLTAGYEIQSVVPFDYDCDGDLDLYYVRGPNWVSAPPVVRDDTLHFFYGAETDAAPKGFRFACSSEMAITCYINSVLRTGDLRLGQDSAPASEKQLVVSPEDPRLEGVPSIDPDKDLGVYLFSPEPGIFELRFVSEASTPYAGIFGRIQAEGGLELLTPKAAEEASYPDALYENRGGHFADVTTAAQILEAGKGSDALSADFDNDGYADLYVLNGGDRYENLSNALYRNRGDGTFEEVAAEAGVEGSKRGRADSAVAFDYDNDGDLDLLVLNGGGPAPLNREGPHKLYRNDTNGRNWVKIDMRGHGPNPFGLGAGVVLEANGRKCYAQRTALTARFAASVTPLHFGLGTAEQGQVTVYWPSGRRTTATAEAGETLLVTEPDPGQQVQGE